MKTVSKYKINKEFKRAEKINDTLEIRNTMLSYEDASENTSLDKLKDGEERIWLLEHISSAIKKIKEDKNTRKAIIYNTYLSDIEHNCLNVFHLYCRKNILFLNVYVRSMDFDKNFDYDIRTFYLLLKKAKEELRIEKGRVLVHIMSLHKFLKK